MMQLSEKNRSKAIILIALIVAGETVFFLPFVIARVFRPTLLKVFEMTNLELGTSFSIYGIVAMISYFFGGMLADRYPARNLMAIALWFTAIGGVVMSSIPSIAVLMALYGYWGFTSIFLFWAALIRATREWGNTDYQGRAFGFLEGGRGLTAAILGSVTLLLFSWFSGVDTFDRNRSFQLVVLTTAAITFLAGIFVWFTIPKSEVILVKRKITSDRLKQLLKTPSLWMQAVIIVCAYVGYKITDDFSLYANVVLGFDEVEAAGVGTMSLWMRPVVAIGAGYLADRISGTKVIVGCFIIAIIGGLMVFLGVLTSITWWVLIVLSFTLIGVYGIRGIYFALMPDAKVPIAATGTAVGIMSVIGFTPDVFMSPLMGFLLDNYPGERGHQYVFLVLVIFSIAGLIASMLLHKKLNNDLK